MRTLLWRLSTKLLRVLDQTLTIFIYVEIEREFSANTYSSAIWFFAGHKFPLFDSCDHCVANVFGRGLQDSSINDITFKVVLQFDNDHALFSFLKRFLGI